MIDMHHLNLYRIITFQRQNQKKRKERVWKSLCWIMEQISNIAIQIQSHQNLAPLKSKIRSTSLLIPVKTRFRRFLTLRILTTVKKKFRMNMMALSLMVYVLILDHHLKKAHLEDTSRQDLMLFINRSFVMSEDFSEININSSK